MNIRLNFAEDANTKGKYLVTLTSEKSISGFSNAFNITLNLKKELAEDLVSALTRKVKVFAIPNGRYGRRYRFEFA